MKRQTRFFTHFLAVGLILLCSGLIATADNHDLVNIQIPPMKDVVGKDAKPEYLNPTLALTNQMIQWANTCRTHAVSLDDRGQVLIAKRDAARKVAFGPGVEWSGSVLDFIEAYFSRNLITPARNVVEKLLKMPNQIDREQAYAEACKTVNEHYYRQRAMRR